MAARRSRRSTKILALAVACLAALLALEVGVRVFKPFGNRLRGNLIVLPVMMRFSWANTTNPKLTPTIVNSRNSLGFRGSEPPADFAAHRTLVAVGGSTTECLMLNDGESWPEVLARELAPRFPDLWINNAGQDGHSTWGHIMMVDQHLADLRPRFCTFLVGVNEIGRVDLNADDATIDPKHNGLLRRLGAESELVCLVRALLRRSHAHAMGLTHEYNDLHKIPDHVVPPGERAAELNFHRSRCLPAYRARLEHLLENTRAIACEPILMTQPALYGNVTDPSTGIAIGERAIDVDYQDGAGTRHLNAKVSWEVLELYNDVTREVARATKTELIDLGHSMPKDSLLFYDWLHYTAEGARAVARLVSPRLAEIVSASH